jgi:hypothetical protein
MMRFSYFVWLLGIALAVIVGLSVFHVYEVPFAIDQLRRFGDDWSAKTLFVALALVALSKLF